jgi:hypothetical protein
MSQYALTLRCTKTDILGKKERRYLKHHVRAPSNRTGVGKTLFYDYFRSDFAFYFNRHAVSKYIEDNKEWPKIFFRNNTDRHESIKYNLQTRITFNEIWVKTNSVMVKKFFFHYTKSQHK